MRPLLSALAVTAWAYAALEAYRGAILDRIRDIVAARVIQTSSGAIVDWAASLRASWYGVVLDVLLFTFIIQLVIYGLWSLTYRATRGFLAWWWSSSSPPASWGSCGSSSGCSYPQARMLSQVPTSWPIWPSTARS
ncbi:MAG: hypothetical protein QXP98_00345 [Thermoproteus sp.]